METQKKFLSKKDHEDQIMSRMIRALDMALSAHTSSRVGIAAEFNIVGHLAVKIYDELKEYDDRISN